ncbi:MAG: AraC family transcriptional regulator [Sphingomonadaceae bacterium]
MQPDHGRNLLHKIPWLHGVEFFDANHTQKSYRRYAHSGFAIGAIRHGVGGNWCRGEAHILPPQTLTLMNPEEPHTGYELTDGLRYSMIYISEEGVQSLLDLRQIKGFTDLNPTDPDLHIITNIVALTNALRGNGTPPAKHMFIEERFHAILRMVFARHGTQSARKGGNEPSSVSRAKEFIEAHVENQPDQDLTIADIAREVNLKPNYLIQCFSRTMGVSPHAYLMQRKICRAKELLGDGLRAIDVATALGFYDQSHFIRHFRKVVGITPGALQIHH